MSRANIYIKEARERLAKNNYCGAFERERIDRAVCGVGELTDWNVAELYAKVAAMEASPEVIPNPLGLLIDAKRYATLKDNEKELYVLRLAALYVELKKRVKASKGA